MSTARPTRLSATWCAAPRLDAAAADGPARLRRQYGGKSGDPGEPTAGADCPAPLHKYGAFYEFFTGSVYRGDLWAETGAAPSVPAWRLNDVEYTVMDRQSQMTCSLGFDGIFGVAFDLLNTAFVVPGGDPSLLLTTCSSSWGDSYPLGSWPQHVEIAVLLWGGRSAPARPLAVTSPASRLLAASRRSRQAMQPAS